MTTPKKPQTVTRHRDAETGEYVTKKEADRNPKTTVKERDKVPARPQPKRK